jgi:hypothetical protein
LWAQLELMNILEMDPNYTPLSFIRNNAKYENSLVHFFYVKVLSIHPLENGWSAAVITDGTDRAVIRFLTKYNNIAVEEIFKISNGFFVTYIDNTMYISCGIETIVKRIVDNDTRIGEETIEFLKNISKPPIMTMHNMVYKPLISDLLHELTVKGSITGHISGLFRVVNVKHINNRNWPKLNMVLTVTQGTKVSVGRISHSIEVAIWDKQKYGHVLDNLPEGTILLLRNAKVKSIERDCVRKLGLTPHPSGFSVINDPQQIVHTTKGLFDQEYGKCYDVNILGAEPCKDSNDTIKLECALKTDTDFHITKDVMIARTVLEDCIPAEYLKTAKSLCGALTKFIRSVPLCIELKIVLDRAIEINLFADESVQHGAKRRPDEDCDDEQHKRKRGPSILDILQENTSDNK